MRNRNTNNLEVKDEIFKNVTRRYPFLFYFLETNERYTIFHEIPVFTKFLKSQYFQKVKDYVFA